MERQRVLGIIPARLLSTRFPGKVLATLSGRPVIEHVYERLASASLVDDVAVATDSAEIEEAVARFGGRSILVRTPCSTGSDRVARAVEGTPADIVVNLQADQPLIDPRDIDGAIAELVATSRLDITTVAYRASDRRGYESRDVVKVAVAEDGRALYFSRAPIPSAKRGETGNPLYLHHVGIYCFRRVALERFAAGPRTALEERECLEQLRALERGLAIGVVITDRVTPGVDRERDLAELEALITNP